MNNKKYTNKAADILLRHFKKPEILLNFLTTALFCIYKYDKRTREKEDYAWFFICIQYNILDAWLKNIRQPNERIKEAISLQFEALFKDQYVSELAPEAIAQLYKSMVIDIAEAPMDEDAAMKILCSAHALKVSFDMYQNYSEYEEVS